MKFWVRSSVVLEQPLPQELLHPEREMVSDVAVLLSMYSLGKEFKQLPRPGGVYDQDCYVMLGLMLVTDAVGERQKKEAAEAEAKARR